MSKYRIGESPGDRDKRGLTLGAKFVGRKRPTHWTKPEQERERAKLGFVKCRCGKKARHDGECT